MKFIEPKKDIPFFAVVLCLLGIFYFFVTSPIVFRPQLKPLSATERADVSLLREDVSYFSSLKPTRAFPNPTLQESAEYINARFLSYCDGVSVQKFQTEGTSTENIICTFNKDRNERIVVGAHYDTFGYTPGADDNASSVAGMLELARILSKNKEKIEKRVDLIAFTLEEPPFFRTHGMGSYKYAESLKNSGVSIKLAIILETIGYYSDQNDSQSFPHWILKAIYPHTGNYALIVSNFKNNLLARKFKASFMEGTDLPVWSLNGPANLFGIDFSDHQSFWGVGYPAVMITDTAMYRNKNYHETADTKETLDYQKMAKVIEGTYTALINI